MFGNIWFWVAVAGWGSFTYVLGHNITTGKAFKAAVQAELAALKKKYDDLQGGTKQA